jgi:predicted permease
LGLLYDIIYGVSLPIMVMIALGWITQSWLKLDLPTLGRLHLNITLPCFIIFHLSTTDAEMAALGEIAWFTVAQFFVLFALGWLSGRFLSAERRHLPVIALAIAFPNTGNYGIPLTELAFGPAWIAPQAVIMTLHSILIMSFGVLAITAGSGDWRASLKASVSSPVLPAIVIGLALNIFDYTLPKPLLFPLEMVAGAFAPIALLLLGASLAVADRKEARRLAPPVTIMKLVAAPLLTWLACLALGFDPMTTAFLTVNACGPVGVMLVIVCAEHDNGRNVAAMTVFTTTLLAPFVATAALYLLRL